MQRWMVVAAMTLGVTVVTACGGDSTGPEPFQGFPCEADVAAAVSRYGQPVATTGDPKDRGTMTFVSEGDTITYTFIGHYDDTYWCEQKIQL